MVPHTTRWLPYRPPDRGGVQLFCFPHAGAGASGYLPWVTEVPAWITVVPVQPPGREGRIREAPYVHIGQMIDDLAEAVVPWLRSPFALFGHSLGALAAFEFARALRRACAPRPILMVVSGRVAPHVTQERPILHRMPPDRLLATLHGLGGIPEELLDRPELLASFLPTLRSDLAMNEEYGYRHESPLDVPLTALYGSDDPLAGARGTEAWQDQTTGDFQLCRVPGGHFFVSTSRREVLAHVVAGVRAYLPRAVGATAPRGRR